MRTIGAVHDANLQSVRVPDGIQEFGESFREFGGAGLGVGH
ncbi:MAG: hypothetical protein ABJC09_11610 [Terriglobia bacterium]